MNLNSPITARLNPADRDLPEDLAQHRIDLNLGIGTPIDVAPGGLRVVLDVPTGLVRPIMTMERDVTVLSSADQKSPRDSTNSPVTSLAETRERPAPRLLFIANRAFAGQCPLVVGHSFLIPTAAGHNSAGAEFRIISFSITTAALQGKSATGSWLEFGWRDISAGADVFESVVIRTGLRGRVAYSENRSSGRRWRGADTDLASPGGSVPEGAGGLNWRLTHDRV